jgi:FkbM family methyltransferase
MLGRIKELAKPLLRRVGYEVVAYTPGRSHELRKMKLIRDRGIALVIDAGANVGQYAERLRGLGYDGRIVSIEPLPAVFEILRRKAAARPGWEALNFAVCDRDGEVEINVAEISEVSSLLPATGAAVTGDWSATRRQKVPSHRLDSLFPDLAAGGDPVYLKMDVQGAERVALDGAERMLGAVVAIELELSTIPLYVGETLLPEMVHHLGRKGFGVFSIDTVLVDNNTGRVLQAEVLFVRDQPTSDQSSPPAR